MSSSIDPYERLDVARAEYRQALQNFENAEPEYIDKAIFEYNTALEGFKNAIMEARRYENNG